MKIPLRPIPALNQDNIYKIMECGIYIAIYCYILTYNVPTLVYCCCVYDAYQSFYGTLEVQWHVWAPHGQAKR